MNFYNHYLGDYARDTKGLSLLEHGAYRLLLDHCYATEEPVPNDVKELYRIAGAMTPAERKAVEKVAERFFPVNGDGRRHNRRADEEIAKAKNWAEDTDARRENERERQRRHRERRQRLFNDLRARGVTPKYDTPTEELERLLNASQPRDGDGDVTQQVTRDVTAIHNHNQNHKPKESNTSPATAGEGRGAAATVQDCPHDKLIALYHELLPTCTRVVEWNGTRQALMRARWREQAVPNGKRPGYTTEAAGLDFWRRYLAYVAESRFLTGGAEGRDGGAPFVATLEWLVRPKNFAKVVEGTYHR